MIWLKLYNIFVELNNNMKICIIKLSAMGDIVHLMATLQFIKKHIPNCSIDWVVESSFGAILEKNSDIDNILLVNLKSIKKDKLSIFKQIKILQTYRKNNYDLVIDAQGLIKSAIVSRIIATKDIIGFDKHSIRESLASLFYTKTVNIGYDQNVIKRNCEVVSSYLGFEITKEDILNKKPFLFYDNYEDLQIDILVVLGASRANKIYPKEKFLEVINRFKDKKIYTIWANQQEKESAKYLSDNSHIKVLDKMDLDKLKYVISKSKIVIGGDTGPVHIAWGLNIPSITIFGNTPWERNTYITPINQIINSNSVVDPLRLDYSDFSIQDIESDEIVAKIKEMMGW